MTPEKIVKLLTEGNIEDVLIVFHLLEDYTFEDVSAFPEASNQGIYRDYCDFPRKRDDGNSRYYKINKNLFGYIGYDSICFRTKSSKIPGIKVINL